MTAFFKTEERSLLLIEEYRKHPILWDPKNENYFKKPLKMDAWCAIASVFEFQDAEEGPKVCENKMVSLLSSFRREIAKEKKSQGGTGKGKFISMSMD